MRIPVDIPELCVEAGDTGCIDSVYRAAVDRLFVLVDRSDPDLPVLGLVELEVLPDGSGRVVGHSKLGGSTPT